LIDTACTDARGCHNAFSSVMVGELEPAAARHSLLALLNRRGMRQIGLISPQSLEQQVIARQEESL
jgi:hypothetical protein